MFNYTYFTILIGNKPNPILCFFSMNIILKYIF
nr:MAG TPA: hypothetical protein [Bacteriophage sp.]